jgi:hypothetical protein
MGFEMELEASSRFLCDKGLPKGHKRWGSAQVNARKDDYQHDNCWQNGLAFFTIYNNPMSNKEEAHEYLALQC